MNREDRRGRERTNKPHDQSEMGER